GGTSFSSATFAPALEYGTEARHGSVAGSLASLPGGAWSLQGRADVWAATRPLLGRMRLGAEGIWAGTRRTDGGWTAAAHGIGVALWWTSNWGVGVGAGAAGGWIQDAPSVGAFHARARAWWRAGPGTTSQLAFEPTHFLGAWFTDVSGGVTLERGPVSTTLWAVGRVSDAYGSKGAASVSLRCIVVPVLSLVARAGTAGGRVPLRPLAGDAWEGAFLRESGLYRFNVLVDGWDWVVPNGVATVRDGLGGLVAVLLVP